VGPLVFVVTPPPLHQPDLLTFEGCGLSGNPRKADAWWAVAVCTTGSNAAVQQVEVPFRKITILFVVLVNRITYHYLL